RTKAMPVSPGRLRSSCVTASNPPADAPMPTMGNSSAEAPHLTRTACSDPGCARSVFADDAAAFCALFGSADLPFERLGVFFMIWLKESWSVGTTRMHLLQPVHGCRARVQKHPRLSPRFPHAIFNVRLRNRWHPHSHTHTHTATQSSSSLQAPDP